MNIYETLLSKCPQTPRNIHYLKRYVRFICDCESHNALNGAAEYTENHHILPKGETFWPEYKNFKQSPWNKSKLTGRQHYIAHWILARALGKGMWLAFDRMSHTSNNHGRSFKISSRVFGELRQEKSKYFSDLTKRRYGRTKTEKELIKDVMDSLNKGVGKMDSVRWVSNGTFEFMTDCYNLPAEFVEGRVESSKLHMKTISNNVKGKVWATNGSDELMVNIDLIPEGYRQGRSCDFSNVVYDRAGEKNTAFGKIWVTDGVTTLYVDPDMIPETFYKGVDDQRRSNQSAKISGRKRYNNGLVEISIPLTDPVPDGFVKGRLKRK